jgi:hypothetical protein
MAVRLGFPRNLAAKRLAPGHRASFQARHRDRLSTGEDMPDDEPSDRIIEQRIRNRIIEQLELAGSFEAQRDHQAAVPFVHVPYAVINGWEDRVRPGCRPLSGSPGALSAGEIDAVKAFNRVWDAVADEVPDD